MARISGADRYATAASLSSTLIDPNPPSTGGTVIVASGESFPDALAGAPAAFANDGPVLLVKAGSIPSPTLAELNRLAPDHVYVLGGTVAVSSAVENQLKSLASTPTVQRIAGVDRYATAAQVAATFFPAQKTVFLASGEAFPDALSAAGAASRRGWPILLTKRTSLPPSTCDRIGAADPTKIYVLGGTVAITDAVAAAAGNCSGATNVSVERLGGADRYATAALVNSEFFTPSNGDHVLVATGVNFPDALAAGAVGDPVFLTTTNDLPTVAFNAITGLDPSSIHVMGGTTVVSQAVVVELQGT
ncbi:MAG TPA: cell wall-binding repeat-containing protein [candidate division Zixibacteria bacterium]|nr:cell wall-binding repeat-containing protein [candidate division Zixibacteria bacterium]